MRLLIHFLERDSYDEIPDHAEFEHENDDFEGNAEKRKKIAYLKKIDKNHHRGERPIPYWNRCEGSRHIFF